MSRKHFAVVTASLLAAMVAVFALSMWLNRHAPEDSSFVGTDSAATAHIEAANPNYKPWFSSIFTPGSGEVESGLFALQAAVGAGIFGFTIGAMWQRRNRATGTTKTAASDQQVADTTDLRSPQ